MARDRGPQPQPLPPDDDPTFGTSWSTNGTDMRSFRNSLERNATRVSWDGDGNPPPQPPKKGDCFSSAASLIAIVAGGYFAIRYGIPT